MAEIIKIRKNDDGTHIDASLFISSIDNNAFKIGLAADEYWSDQKKSILADLHSTVLSPTNAPKDISACNQILLDHLGQDLHWSWSNKVLHYLRIGPNEYDLFHLEIDGKIEGLLIAYHPKPSELELGNIFYIDYIATAPFNRATPSFKPRYSKVGSSLISNACQFYQDKEYKLGFSLHALDQAKSYYLSIGMTELGIDPSKENLTKFEMHSSTCTTFLKKEGAL